MKSSNQTQIVVNYNGTFQNWSPLSNALKMDTTYEYDDYATDRSVLNNKPPVNSFQQQPKKAQQSHAYLNAMKALQKRVKELEEELSQTNDPSNTNIPILEQKIDFLAKYNQEKDDEILFLKNMIEKNNTVTKELKHSFEYEIKELKQAIVMLLEEVNTMEMSNKNIDKKFDAKKNNKQILLSTSALEDSKISNPLETPEFVNNSKNDISRNSKSQSSILKSESSFLSNTPVLTKRNSKNSEISQKFEQDKSNLVIKKKLFDEESTNENKNDQNTKESSLQMNVNTQSNKENGVQHIKNSEIQKNIRSILGSKRNSKNT